MNQAQLQSSLSLVRKQIQRVQKNIKNVKLASNYYYKAADKDKPETIHAFTALNGCRSHLRKEKQRLKRLVALSISLKKEIRNPRQIVEESLQGS